MATCPCVPRPARHCTETMRTLLIDAGNSSVKFAMSDANGLATATSVPYAAGTLNVPPEDFQDFRVRLEESLRDRGLARGATAVGCIVASNTARAAIVAAASAVTGTELAWLGAQPVFDHAGTRLVNGYREPAQLGADRWHAMLGARADAGGAAFVLVQAGTATTIDGVDANGLFFGGEILPGWDMMLASLARGTARLPHATGVAAAFADNTDDAIASGALDAQAGAVERFWRRCVARHAIDATARLMLTGGDAQRLAEALNSSVVFANTAPTIQDNLVLRGLRLRSRLLSVN